MKDSNIVKEQFVPESIKMYKIPITSPCGITKKPGLPLCGSVTHYCLRECGIFPYRIWGWLYPYPADDDGMTVQSGTRTARAAFMTRGGFCYSNLPGFMVYWVINSDMFTVWEGKHEGRVYYL